MCKLKVKNKSKSVFGNILKSDLEKTPSTHCGPVMFY